MVERIAHRELRNSSAEVLRRVAEGETYEVTNHGDVVAILSPPGPRPSLRVRRASTQGGFSGLPRVRLDRSTQEILDELRAER